jgi:acetoin utilization deacetylase AcuC-like enzyme
MGHPESPRRLVAVLEGLQAAGLTDRLVPIEPAPAGQEDLRLVHQDRYIALVRQEVLSGRRVLSTDPTGETGICPRSWEVALLAAGGAMAAVKAVCSGQVRSAFCAVRPPGHHATPSAGMGFCIFNNAAIAARHARNRCGVGKVLIVDWDLHHGNGTQEAFYEDPTVFYFSIHQRGQYPMLFTGQGHAGETGAGAGKGTNLNCPLPGGSGDREFLAVFADLLVPAAEKFRPELVIISAGFDCREGDPLGRLAVTDEGFARMTDLVKSIAADSAGGRIVSVLEGGYDLAGLGSAAAAHVRALME